MVQFEENDQPVLIFYTEIDLLRNENAQERLLGQFGMKRSSLLKLSKRLSSKEFGFETRTSIRNFSQIGLKNIQVSALTKWIALQPLSLNSKEEHAYSVAPQTAPLSLASGCLTLKTRLISPVYLSESFILNHFNNSNYYVVDEKYQKIFRLTKKRKLVITDKEAIDAQRSALKEILKQLATSFFGGKDSSNIALPLKIMDPRSLVHAFSDLLANLDLLHKAVQAPNHLESFKFVIAYSISNFYYGINFLKPLHPYIGETMQGYFSEGTLFYAEHINHNPPITLFLLINEKAGFRVSFKVETGFKMSSNDIKNHFKGVMCVRIGDESIFVQWPQIQIQGLLYGKMRVSLEDRFFFHYPQQNLKAFVEIGSSAAADLLEGGIYVSSESEAVSSDNFAKNIFPSLSSKALSQLDLVSKISGNWIQEIKIDDRTYWNTEERAHRIQIEEDALPSDWRFREDLLWMLYGKIDYAQQWKDFLAGLHRERRKMKEEMDKPKKKNGSG